MTLLHAIIVQFFIHKPVIFAVIQYVHNVFRWLDGAFKELNAENIEVEVDEYWREVYKVQKVFNQKVKKMTMERDERERERKKKRRHAEDSEEAEKEAEEEFHPPAAVAVCRDVQDAMKDFKVCDPGDLIYCALCFLLC